MHRFATTAAWWLYMASCACCMASCHTGRDSAAARDTPASDGAPNTAVVGSAAAVPPAPMTDAEVRQAVIEELFRAPHVRGASLVVSCTDGIVQLTGTVDNLLAKDRAVAIAESVRGVRAVSDRVQVAPVSRPDADIEKGVRSAFLYDPAADSYQVNVSSTKGVVRLTGKVDSWAERRLSERLARGVRGVKGVQNDITVRLFAPRSDDDIKKDVASRLRWDTGVNDGHVQVAVRSGVVELSGTVGSAAEKTDAYFDGWVHGVRNVTTSGLKVESWARDDDLRMGKYAHRTDAEIMAAVRDALTYDPRLKSLRVDPVVQDGEVTLTGTVSSLKAKLAAESVAAHTVGVRALYNELSVSPGKPVDDATLAKRISSAVADNPLLQAGDIKVKVKDGAATLSGEVATNFASAEAVDVAGSLEGVRSVTNQLVVTAPELPFVWQAHVFPFGPYVAGWSYVAPAPTGSDDAIARRIKRELKWSPYVDESQVHVTVHDGKATLTGTVDSYRERQAAAEGALEGGAIRVENQLKVG